MQNLMNGNVLSKILPAFDLGLLLMLIMFGLTGLGKLTADADVTGSKAGRPNPTTLEEMGHQLKSVAAENDELQKRLDEAKAEVSDLEDRLNTAGACRLSDKRVKGEKERIRKLQNELKKQKMVLDRLQPQVDEVKKEESLLKKMESDLRKLTKKLRHIEEQNRIFAEDIAKDRKELLMRPTPTIRVESAPQVSMDTNRTPVYIALIKGTITPVLEPFYTQKERVEDLGGGRFERVVESTLKRGGETIDQALDRRSALAGVLKDINPEHDYVALLVDSESFNTFRAIREVLRSREIPFGWEPSAPAAIRFSAAGQIIGEEIDE